MSLVVFTAISVPLSVSFGMPEGVGMDVLAHAITVLFGLDLIANFRTAYFDFQVRPTACMSTGVFTITALVPPTMTVNATTVKWSVHTLESET